MKERLDNVTQEELVELVKVRRMLWDPEEPDYYRYNVTEVAWREIGQLLDLPDGTTAKKKWQGLKNYYFQTIMDKERAEIDKQNGVEPVEPKRKRNKTWKHLDALSFLDEVSHRYIDKVRNVRDTPRRFVSEPEQPDPSIQSGTSDDEEPVESNSGPKPLFVTAAPSHSRPVNVERKPATNEISRFFNPRPVAQQERPTAVTVEQQIDPFCLSLNAVLLQVSEANAMELKMEVEQAISRARRRHLGGLYKSSD